MPDNQKTAHLDERQGEQDFADQARKVVEMLTIGRMTASDWKRRQRAEQEARRKDRQ